STEPLPASITLDRLRAKVAQASSVSSIQADRIADDPRPDQFQIVDVGGQTGPWRETLATTSEVDVRGRQAGASCGKSPCAPIYLTLREAGTSRCRIAGPAHLAGDWWSLPHVRVGDADTVARPEI